MSASCFWLHPVPAALSRPAKSKRKREFPLQGRAEQAVAQASPWLLPWWVYALGFGVVAFIAHKAWRMVAALRFVGRN